MKKVLIFVIILFITLVGTGLFWLSRNPQSNLLNLSFGAKESVTEQIEDNKPASTEPVFRNLGPTPELVGLQKWFNSEPVELALLQGKVVLVNFWTYSCINCIRTFPYITEWHDSYKDQGLVVIGIHTPEFAFERVASNVETAIKRYAINYPVAQDNNYQTWRAFQNQFWPAQYLIDKNGDIVYTHFGEGQYEKTEKAIRLLLGLEGEFTSPPAEIVTNSTPEMYLGTLRLKNFGGTEQPLAQEQIYAFPKRLAKNQFALEGRWRFEPEALIHTQGYGRLRLNFNSAKVSMVAQSLKPITVKVYIDGQLQKGVTISESNLYPLYESNQAEAHTLEIELPESGAQIFTFTFN